MSRGGRLFKLVAIMTVMLFVCHWLACLWFFVGNSSEEMENVQGAPAFLGFMHYFTIRTEAVTEITLGFDSFHVWFLY
eukprot:COSAG01_NODE_3921_length_5535_cov_44.878933_9_plen_78_part_00